MRTKFLRTLAVAGCILALTGCHSRSYREGAAYGPPPGDYGVGLDETTAPLPVAAAEKGFVDRHPILAAPRNYYRDSSDNLLAKVFYGTVVGIPVGVSREVWQIVYGQ